MFLNGSEVERLICTVTDFVSVLTVAEKRLDNEQSERKFLSLCVYSKTYKNPCKNAFGKTKGLIVPAKSTLIIVEDPEGISTTTPWPKAL